MIHYDLLGYILFAFVTSITPGPNNILLFSQGKKFGFRYSIQLMFGIFCGFMVLLYISGYGIAELITHSSLLALMLKIVSSLWLFYLAFVLRICNFETSLTDTNSKVGFFQGFFMQFINPKAWIMAIAGTSAYMPHLRNVHVNVFIFALSFGLVGIPCMISWVVLGDMIAKMLKSEKANRFLGYSLSGLMIISIFMIWI